MIAVDGSGDPIGILGSARNRIVPVAASGVHASADLPGLVEIDVEFTIGIKGQRPLRQERAKGVEIPLNAIRHAGETNTVRKLVD